MRTRRSGRVLPILLAIALVAAGLACGSAAAPTAGPLPEFTMPPAWTPTPEPKAMTVPGWEAFHGEGLELMLPPTYEGGDPVALAEELAGLLAEYPEYAFLAEAIRADPGGYRLLTIDRDTGSIVAATTHDVPASVSMSEYVDKFSAAVVEQVPGTTVIQTGIVPFRDGEAGWMLFEFVGPESVSWQLSYAVRRGDSVWNLDYGAVREDYPRLQPIFDQSLQTVVFTP
jgi:serine/threonine-protein kinase